MQACLHRRRQAALKGRASMKSCRRFVAEQRRISPPTSVLTFLVTVRRWWAAAISKAPAPGTTAPSSTVFFTARSPSRMASLICASVWSAGPCRRYEMLRDII